MKRAIVFLHGYSPDEAVVKSTVKSDDVVICADGGAEYAREWGIVPDVIIGDFDSVSEETLSFFKKKNVDIIKHPRMKDETDSELAVNYAIETDAQEIVIFGLEGNRFDHVLANIFFIATRHRDIQLSFINNAMHAHIVHSRILLHGSKGNCVSLIPVGGDAKGVTTKNLKWELSDASLTFGSPRGVSNEMTNSEAHVSVVKGVLLVVHYKTKQ